MLSRPQWLQMRRTGIGGSDVAPILGLSPWRSAMDVWLEKKGLRPEKPDPDRDFLLDLGQRLEPVIADLYFNKTGLHTTGGTFTKHKEFPELCATPDRLVVEPGDHTKFLGRGVELKTENQFSDQFGDPGTAEVPIHYALQCAHYMYVLDCPRWDVAVLHGGVRFAVYELERDKDLEEMIEGQLREWWAKHIVGDVPPDVDGSDAWRVYVHQKFPTNLTPMETLPEHSHLMDTLRKIRDAEKALEVMRTKAENELKEVIGEREGIITNVGRVTWKKTKDSQITNWERAYVELRSAIRETLQEVIPEAKPMAAALKAFDEIADKYKKELTTTRPGSRRLLFTPRKDFYGIQFANDGKAIDAPAAALLAGNSERGTGGAS